MISASLRSILLAIGAVLTAGVLGAVLGLSGVFAGPTVAGTYSPPERRVSPAICVEGNTFLGYMPAGARVVIGYRNADTTWVGIVAAGPERGSEFRWFDIGWLPLDVVTVDPGEIDLSTLPVGGACPEVTLADDPAPDPEPDPAPDPAPDPGPDPEPDPGGGGGPAPDTTPPTIGTPTITPGIVACDTGYTNPPTATVRVAASDDRGVSRVEIRWSGVVSGSGLMTPGSPYTFIFDPPGGHSGGNVFFNVLAYDAAGNVSAQPTFGATVECLG